ncbi:MAG: hypothetical protein U9R26_07415 [Campylobacterota bacterium]|nr:hypothetical protein [Campylobacterota bacterium]
MLIRSGKIQFLFWTSFFSVLLYLWIVAIGLQTFVLPAEKPMELPQETIGLIFILYGFLVVAALGGTIVSIMIDNKFYTKFFGGMVIIVFATIIASRGMFG